MVGKGNTSNVKSGGRDSTGASGGDDGRLSLLEKPLDGFAISLMA